MINYFTTGNTLNANEEQKNFLNILYHDVRNGFTLKSFKNEDTFSQIAFKSTDLNKRLQKMEEHTSHSDVFVSLNSFTCPKRRLKKLYNRTALILDLDVHGKSDYETSKTVNKTIERLNKAYNIGELCPPTMITFTGRGLCLYYVLANSIPATSTYANAHKKATYLQEALFTRYEEILGNAYCDVDHVVKDTTRIVRLPGTLNQKNGQFCRLLGITRNSDNEPLYYDLYRLEKECKLNSSSSSITKSINTHVTPFKEYNLSFLDKRIEKLEKLIDMRNGNCEGTRDLILFSICNASIQRDGICYALNRIKYDNQKFVNPLSEEEVEHIFDTILLTNNHFDQGGFYPLSNKWIMDAVRMTEEENQALHFDGVSLRRAERKEAKERTMQKREERNNYIISLATSTDMIYSDIAKKVAEKYGKCSERLVKLTLKNAGIFRYNKSAKFCRESIDVVNEHSELPMLDRGSTQIYQFGKTHDEKIELFSIDLEKHILDLYERDSIKYKSHYDAMNYIKDFYYNNIQSLPLNDIVYTFTKNNSKYYINATEIIKTLNSLSQIQLGDLVNTISRYYSKGYNSNYIQRMLLLHIYDKYQRVFVNTNVNTNTNSLINIHNQRYKLSNNLTPAEEKLFVTR